MLFLPFPFNYFQLRFMCNVPTMAIFLDCVFYHRQRDMIQVGNYSDICTKMGYLQRNIIDFETNN